ncbi:MAG TPA: glycoside hydrolase family 38 C-terminal domain-containing protein, partial [Candidatus Bathyarchaeia archaeon]|nr:glycoside hydrolase family 38 C-terminal domain-containing protein [Candidatus Bathyarchaeia archaeon]
AQGAAAKPGLEAAPTVLLVKDPAGTMQIVDLAIEFPGAVPAQASIKAKLDGQATAVTPSSVLLQPGRNAVPVRVLAPAKPVKARFEVAWTSGAGPVSFSREVGLEPARPWTVYLFHHSHTDIGYTELQSRVARNHVEYLDSVIKYCRETDNYPDAAKFRWNIEVTWSLENFIKTRPAADVETLVGLIKAGRIELSALYLQLSDCFAHEEIARTVDAARDFARRYGFDIRSAMNNDVNGFAWSLPQVFRQAGVRYFATGINETRSRAPLRRPNAFWWESPDGSRILHWNGEHYLFGNYDLLLHEAVDRSAPKVGEYLAKLQGRGDYPQDIIAFNVGAWTTDNCPPGRQLSDRVKEWNERFVSPKLRLATMREFFGEMEKRYGASLPVHKLGWPDYWTDGVASTAFETGLNRLAHNEILSAEKTAAIAAALDPAKAFAFPRDEIREGHALSMLYDEHTWGAYNSIDAPWSELARGQWAEKSRFAYEARETSRTLLRRGSEALARLMSAGGANEFVVFNPLSWPRTDVVRVTLPAGPLREAKGRLRVMDRRTGIATKFEAQGEDAVLVLAKDVPAMGCAVFAVEKADAAPVAAQAAAAPAGTIENRFYRVTVDPKTGGISSLFDKELGRELVDQASPWPLNTYIYEQPDGGRAAVDDMTKRAVFHRWSAESAKVEAVERGAVATSLVVTSAPKMCASLRQRIVLYDDVKRIDLVDVMDKEETFVPEAVYFAFPFKVGEAAPAVRMEIAGADMVPGREQLPGTTLDWQTAQHWVEFAGKDARVVWSPVEAPLVEFGDINTGKWQKSLDLRNAWVFSYAMNNYWMTNFKASQEGRVEFRYSLTSLPPGAGPDRVSASRFGWEVHTPLVAAWVPAGTKGPVASPGESFLSVDRPNVIVQALWLDADGTPVVRLREIGGEAAEGRVTGRLLAAPVAFKVRPFEMQTVRLAR